MTKDDFLAAALRNPIHEQILRGLAALALPDAWLVSGCLVQTVWNVMTGRIVDYGILDYDVFYFDPDTSWEAEGAVIRKLEQHLALPNTTVESRNQARVHLWYEQKFGKPYPPLTRATDGIDRFLMPCAQVGIRPTKGACAVYAPKGFADIEAMIVRPNVTANFSSERFREKAERWQALWPEITILPG